MSWDDLADLSDKDKRFIAACHALQALVNQAYTEFGLELSTETDLARYAVELSDALLKELERK